MSKISAIILIFGLLSNPLQAQLYSYDVFKGDKPIGNMDVKLSIDGEKEEVAIKSVVDFKIIFNFQVIYSLQETFIAGTLHSGSGYNTLNGSYQKQTTIAKKENNYKLEMDGVEVSVGENDIRYTVSRIYFEEPENGQKTYSQTFGKWLTFEKSGSHKYRLPTPDGENIYYYTNGICTRVEVNRDYGDVAFIMKPDCLARVKKESNH